MSSESPVEFPRISAEITVNINDLRLRAMRGEKISLDEYRAGVLKIRELFGQRVAAKLQAAPKTRTATKSKAKATPMSVQDADDLLKGL